MLLSPVFRVASGAVGARDSRILLRHVLPNSMAPLLVLITLSMAAGVLAEAGRALGLGPIRLMTLVILPQALANVIPAIVNTFTALLKETTLVLIIGLFDFLGTIQSALTDPSWAAPTTATTGYFFAALVFWALCFSLSRYAASIERSLARSRGRAREDER